MPDIWTFSKNSFCNFFKLFTDIFKYIWSQGIQFPHPVEGIPQHRQTIWLRIPDWMVFIEFHMILCVQNDYMHNRNASHQLIGLSSAVRYTFSSQSEQILLNTVHRHLGSNVPPQFRLVFFSSLCLLALHWQPKGKWYLLENKAPGKYWKISKIPSGFSMDLI